MKLLLPHKGNPLLLFRLKNYKWLDVNILSVLKGDRSKCYMVSVEERCVR